MRRAKSNVAPLLWKAYTLCGELEYSAPEVLLCTGHGLLIYLHFHIICVQCCILIYLCIYMILCWIKDFSVDHWALGCLIHELLTGRTPFAGTSTLHSKLELHEKILSTLSGGMKTGRREVAVDVQRLTHTWAYDSKYDTVYILVNTLLPLFSFRYFSPGLSPQAAELIADLMKPQPEHRLGSRIKVSFGYPSIVIYFTAFIFLLL